MSAVKIGASRQVIIPKKVYEELGLAAGDYLDVTVQDGSLLMSPKTLVDKPMQRQVADLVPPPTACLSHCHPLKLCLRKTSTQTGFSTNMAPKTWAWDSMWRSLQTLTTLALIVQRSLEELGEWRLMC